MTDDHNVSSDDMRVVRTDPETDAAAERRVLEERARRLAETAAAGDERGAGEDVLVFRRGGERWAIALDAVAEVQRRPPLTMLPASAAPVVGVIAWRGRVLTVIDVVTGGRRPAIDEDWRAIVVGGSRARVAFVADVVDETRSIAPDELRALDEPASAATAVPIRGVTPDALIVMDAQVLLQRYAG